MSALKDELRQLRQQRIAQLSALHGNELAKAIWAAERAKAIAELRAQQQREKAALRKITVLAWKPWLEVQAARGDRAAQAALRGIRYREQRKANKALPGFEGEDLDERLEAPAARGRLEQGKGGTEVAARAAQVLQHYEIDELRQRVLYRDRDGSVALEYKGQRMDCVKHDDDAVIEAGLLLTAQKFGGEVLITGDDAFKRRAAEIAWRLGIRVANPEIQRPRAPQNELQR